MVGLWNTAGSLNPLPSCSSWTYWRKLVALAYTGIRVQRLRAILSASGITVGIAAVIAILAIGEGAREEALQQIQHLGTNTIIVRRATLSAETAHAGPAGTPGLRVGDAVRLERISPHISGIIPATESWVMALVGDREVKSRLVGTTPEARGIKKLGLKVGRFFVSEDAHQRRAVCVLGEQISRKLFQLASPLGRGVRIGSDWFQVVGVLAGRARPDAPQGAIQAQDINQNIYVPLEVVASGADIREDWPIHELTLQVAAETKVMETARLVRDVLTRTHRGVQDYEVIIPLELLKQRQQTQTIFNAVLAGIAGLSLLVGGIGIMNIMLATVTERTPEIGVRRAVGATAQDIALQFLTETATLTFLGGVMGVVLGVVGSWGLTVVWNWPVVVSLSTVGGVLGVSILCGLVFGLYPALSAAAANPIEALRYE